MVVEELWDLYFPIRFDVGIISHMPVDVKTYSPGDEAKLRAFGARLRAAREAAGYSVTELAKVASLSRRYLTEAEAGRANPSLLKLSALAEGLGVGVAALLVTSQRRTERVALVGLRGAGKTTLGKRLALELEVPFVELDERVEELAGLSLSEVFDLHGVKRFRELEAEALENVLREEGERIVLATSGSIIDAPQTWARLRATCRTVWLRAEPEEHMRRVMEQGDRRPMRDRPRAMEELRQLLEERQGRYEECDRVVETGGQGSDRLVAELSSWVAGD